MSGVFFLTVIKIWSIFTEYFLSMSKNKHFIIFFCNQNFILLENWVLNIWLENNFIIKLRKKNPLLTESSQECWENSKKSETETAVSLVKNNANTIVSYQKWTKLYGGFNFTKNTKDENAAFSIENIEKKLENAVNTFSQYLHKNDDERKVQV